MYIAIDVYIAHYDIQRAWNFKRTFNTFLDAFTYVNSLPDWKNYSIFYIP